MPVGRGISSLIAGVSQLRTGIIEMSADAARLPVLAVAQGFRFENHARFLAWTGAFSVHSDAAAQVDGQAYVPSPQADSSQLVS